MPTFQQQGLNAPQMRYQLDTLCINPKEGMLVVLPSYLVHAVLPHHSDRP